MTHPASQPSVAPTPDPREDSLYELLRRCHRAELEGLADVLKVRHQDLGLGALARRLDRALRQRGGHEAANVLLRRGDGPPWATSVARLARRMDVVPSGDVREDERHLLEVWVRRQWHTLSDEQREAAWRELALVPPAPESGEHAIAAASARSPAWPLAVVGTYAAPAAILALAPMGPLAGCATLLYLGRPRDAQLLPAALEVARLRQLARHRITVGVVGSPSSGKDAAINAIFGIHSGNINPIAGSTKTVAITRIPEATALYVVNTPGLGDVIASVTENARQVLDLVDVYVYVVNAQGGVQRREHADYSGAVARGRPVLAVINKVDTLREDDRARYLADARAKLNAPADAFLAAAFDPLPQLSETPIGVDAVRTWLAQALVSLGKDPAEVAGALHLSPVTDAQIEL